MLNCLGLLCYTSQGAHQDLLQVETVRNQPFVTLKSTFFQAAFLWKRLFYSYQLSILFCIPLESFKIQHLMLMGERRKSQDF